MADAELYDDPRAGLPLTSSEGFTVAGVLAVVSVVLELVGLAAIVVASWVTAWPLGLAVSGALLVAGGYVLDPGDGKVDR